MFADFSNAVLRVIARLEDRRRSCIPLSAIEELALRRGLTYSIEAEKIAAMLGVIPDHSLTSAEIYQEAKSLQE